MRLTVTVLPGAGARPIEVALDADPATPVRALGVAVADALAGGGGHVGEVGDATVWVHDEPLVLDDPVAATALRSGCVLSLGAVPPAAPRPVPAGLQLRVVGGPNAGLVAGLTGGALPGAALPSGLVVGRGGAALPLTDPRVSRRHLHVAVGAPGVTVEDLGSSNGSTLDGEPLLSPAPFLPGQLLRIGETLLALVHAGPPDAAVHPDGDGGLSYNRPPRLLPPPRETTVTLPSEPTDEQARGFPLLAVLLPLAFGGALATVLGRPAYLLFALLSPVVLVGNHVSERRRGRTSARQRQRVYDDALRAAHERLEVARRAETQARREDAPDPAELLATATGPRRRLWERRRDDEDALHVRVGVADLPARVHLVHPRSTADQAADTVHDPVVVRDVPVVLPLREVGVLGLAGPRHVTRALARWLVGQLAVLHSPRDVTVVVLTERAAARDWDWVRWLPHARPADGQDTVVLMGNDSRSTAARTAELAALVRGRAEAARATAGRAGPPADVVVVLDGARALRQLPGLAQVLREGPALGVRAVCLDEQERLLPEECTATVVCCAREPTRAVVRRARHDEVADVLLDQVAPGWAEQAARCLAPVRDVGADADDAGLPTTARLLDLLGLEPPSPGPVAAGWRQGGRSTRAVVGVGADGPVSLDLARDGPHGLVAGTTGSGKSELLQTVVASLAVANRPDELTFVLVDYKGGSAFAECVRLPHVVGMVTDLDPHLVQRALVSLGAELRRREHALAAAGAKDVAAYAQLRAARDDLPAVPRLLLVVDEFAALARELPEFVSGLVDVAQRGRSLGIHLLLATQRPGGVVSPEIRANTGLRIALRVTDPAESSDVLDAPDAARIPAAAPGRAVARLDHGTLVPFQAGRVGGRRPGPASLTAAPPTVVPLPWQHLGAPPTRPPAPPPVAKQEATDLGALVTAVRGAAAELDVPPPRSPWLAPLPDALVLDALVPDALVPRPATAGLLPAPYGLEDLPDQQAQRPAVLDLRTDGHLFAIGAPRSGRSQLLRTLAASLARLHGCDDVHLYGVDCGSGALLALAALPHCGAVVTCSEPERATRLLGRLTGELERRQALLAAGGHGSLEELRAASPAGQRPAHLVVLLDRWEGFCSSLGEADGGALQDLVLALLREGAAAGIHLVVTGDRTLLLGRVAATTEDRLVFRLADRGDYAVVGLPARAVPQDLPAGRALRGSGGTALQVALLVDDPAGQAQAAALGDLALACTGRDAGVARERRPFRVDVLPASVDLATALALRPAGTGPLDALVGVGGDDLAGVTCDLSGSTPSFVVAGPPRSGRSTALVALAHGFLAAGTDVVLVAPRPSPLTGLSGLPGVRRVLCGPDLPERELAGLLEGDGPLAVLLDDAEGLRDCGAAELLRRLVKGTSGPPRAIVLAGATDDLCAGFTGWLVDARKARQGALLSPRALADGDLLGVRLPRSALGQPVVPGRALVHTGDGRLVAVQVAA